MEAFRRYLRDHSLPVTQQREAVAGAVFFADRHVSVGDLERALADRRANVGKATVYRTLELLVRAGLIQEHDFGEGFAAEPLAARGYHEHLIWAVRARTEFASERLPA
jgi:Fur family ferric uptake transcriptional regulator